MKTSSEIEHKADFSLLRYAQVWEDADILLEALDIRPNDHCVSIASAGDNALAMLARGPKKVVALDLNPVQIHALELRVAAYRCLSHQSLLKLMGSIPCENRSALYRRCAEQLSKEARKFWESRLNVVERHGIGGAGKFERYFRLFKNYVLPLVHSRKSVESLLTPKSKAERKAYFDRHWNTWRWRLLFRLFFSRPVMGKLGRDPAFFAYIEDDFAAHLFDKVRLGLVEQNPAKNPYLQWILRGEHRNVLPYALRAENFEAIKANLSRLEWHLWSTERYVKHCQDRGIRIDKFNLSNIFEYMSEANYRDVLSSLVAIGSPGGRLAYWNMMVPRSRPNSFADRLESLSDLSAKLLKRDKAIFYRNFIIEEIR